MGTDVAVAWWEFVVIMGTGECRAWGVAVVVLCLFYARVDLSAGGQDLLPPPFFLRIPSIERWARCDSGRAYADLLAQSI